MAGKREQHTPRRWPGSLMALAAVCLLLTLGGPRGAAADSPLDLPLREPGEPAGPAAQTEEPAPPEASPTSETALRWAGPVPESLPAEDSYFADAVFLGDSRTDGFRLYSGLGTGTYLCATGVTVESVFTKDFDTPLGRMPLLDALSQMDCGKIYVMLGVNELGWPGTDLFREKSERLILRLQADHPDAQIFIQSILPVSARQDAKGSYVNNQRVADYNAVWQDLAEELGTFYVAVGDVLTGEDGCLPADLNFDGVHLNPAGCAIWLDYLRTHTVSQLSLELDTEPSS
ncbi:MAG: hypothetical protein HFG09_03030 [Oscillibacter sp.]|nr:hypothetical protein [Oscillibacter sp.]